MSRKGKGLRKKPATAGLTELEALVARYLDDLLTRGYSPETTKTRGYHLAKLAGWLAERGVTRPAEVTKPMLDRYQRWLYHYRRDNGAPLSFRSQHGALVPVRGLFKWLARSNHILYNPASELELPKMERRLPKAVLSVEEAEAVLAAVFDEEGVRGKRYGVGKRRVAAVVPKNRGENPGDANPIPRTPDPVPPNQYESPTTDPLRLRDRAILELLYATGLRRAEMVSLKVFDLDPERGTVTVRQGKGRKDRMLPLGERAAAWVSKYVLEARPQLAVEPDDGTLFLTNVGEPFSTDFLTQLVRTYVEAAGIGKAGACHLFRHTMATLMLEGGADIRFIQQMLGHADISTTQIYTQVSIRKLREIHAATHPGARLRRLAGGSPPTLPEAAPAALAALLADDEDDSR